ncbi:MAG: hypothetical protein V7746_22895 [Halioglobus sp.]
MNRIHLRALAWGVGVALYLRFGLEPTGWLFYEASHALSVDWLYWGYSVFRGGAYALSLWDYQAAACILIGAACGLMIQWRLKRRETP